jgi:hypothetical protein
MGICKLIYLGIESYQNLAGKAWKMKYLIFLGH